MKALFITTDTVDCKNHVRAWNSCFDKAEHFMFAVSQLNNSWQVVEAATRINPDVIFYIGANKGRALPRKSEFIQLREIAKTINICSDAQDEPWHRTLGAYRDAECFDLQVAIDGAINSPVDLSTLTPIDPNPFNVNVTRDIHCGFSGSIGRWNVRSEIIKALVWFAGVQVRSRESGDDSYEAHAKYMKRCKMLINVANTGTGNDYHIKGRVVEAGWAGCALLESEGSPIQHWFPEDCYFKYRDPVHAKELIDTLTDEQINKAASRLAEEVRSKYTAKQIYTGILDRVGLAKP